MKKLLVTIALSFIAFGAYSQKIKVTSGSVDFLKGEKTIIAQFTYDDMTVGRMSEKDYVSDKVEKLNKKEPGRCDEWRTNWTADRANRFEPKFSELFNKNMLNGNGPLIREEGAYTLLINTYFSEPGYNVGVSRKNASVSLTCKLISNETKEVMATITVVDASANNFFGTDFDTGYRLQESYAKAGRELSSFLLKKIK